MSYRLSATIEVGNLERLAEAKVAINTLVMETRKEPGCVKFEVHQNKDVPHRFTLWEIWTSEEALQTHFSTQHYKDYEVHNFTHVVYVEKLEEPLGLLGEMQ